MDLRLVFKMLKLRSKDKRASSSSSSQSNAHSDAKSRGGKTTLDLFVLLLLWGVVGFIFLI